MGEQDTGNEPGAGTGAGTQTQAPSTDGGQAGQSGNAEGHQAEAEVVARGQYNRDTQKLRQTVESEKARADTLQAELDERKRAEMTESDRLKADLDAERAERQKADAEKALLLRENRRALFLAQKARELPAAYHSRIDGDDEEALTESLGNATEEYQADAKAVLNAQVRDLVGMDPDEMAKLGEPYAALAARLKGKPVSIGSGTVSGAPAAPPPPDSPEAQKSMSWWIKQAKASRE